MNGTWVMNWLKLLDNCATPDSSMEYRLSARRVTRISPAGVTADAWGADPRGAGGAAAFVGRTRLPTGSRSSFSRSFPRVIHTLSRSMEERSAPGSTSSFSRNAFGCFIPSAQRIARRTEGVEETMVPTRMKAVRAGWDSPFPLAEERRDGSFIPCPGAKRLFHCSGGHNDGNSKHGEVNRFSHPLPGKWFTNNHFGRITGIPSTTGRYPVNHGSLRRRRFAAKGFSSPLLTRSVRNAYDGRTGAPMTEPTPGPQGLNVQESLDFLREIVRRDTRSGVYGGRGGPRFPPQPHGVPPLRPPKCI